VSAEITFRCFGLMPIEVQHNLSTFFGALWLAQQE